MALLKFQINHDTFDLEPEMYNIKLPSEVWRELASKIREQANMVPYPPYDLEERWRNGLAAIAIEGEEIVSYISLRPIYTDKVRKYLALITMRSPLVLPQTNIFESASGYTIERLKNRGINLKLRDKLLKNFGNEQTLVMGVCRGKSSSMLLRRLDWHLHAWKEVPFASSFLGWFDDEVYYKPNGFAYSLGRMKPYNGDEPPTEEIFSSHEWDDYFHLWVSNKELCTEVNSKLQELFRNNIEQFRKFLKLVTTSNIEVA